MRYAKQIVVSAACVFAIVTPSAAQTVAVGPAHSIVSAPTNSPMTSLWSQAERQAKNLVLEYAPAAAGGQEDAAEQSRKKRALTIGLIGVGTAVAGLFVYRSAEDTPSNLPGITSGGKIAGGAMLVGGGVFGALGLWQGLK